MSLLFSNVKHLVDQIDPRENPEQHLKEDAREEQKREEKTELKMELKIVTMQGALASCPGFPRQMRAWRRRSVAERPSRTPRRGVESLRPSH